jgi:hypothetical protein
MTSHPKQVWPVRALGCPDVAAGSAVDSSGGANHRNLREPAVDHPDVRPQKVPASPTLRK